MPDDREDKKIHAIAKPASAPSWKPADGDLTCSESQIEDILSEGVQQSDEQERQGPSCETPAEVLAVSS
jgi:hypothetical protein